MCRSSSGSRRWRSAGRPATGILPDDPGEEDDLADLDQGGGQRRAARAHRRNPPERPRPRRQARAPEHQQDVAEQVDHVRQHRGPDQGPGGTHRLHVAALGVEDEQRGDSRKAPVDEGPARLGDVRGDAEALEQAGEDQRRRDEEQARHHRHPERLPVQPSRPQRIPRAQGLADERVHPHQRADAEDGHGEDDGVPQRRTGELHRPRASRRPRCPRAPSAPARPAPARAAAPGAPAGGAPRVGSWEWGREAT